MSEVDGVVIRQITRKKMETIFVNISDLKDPNDELGRTYREVNNAMKHKFGVGTLVEIHDGVRLFVAKQTRDCDGTPLYCLTPEKGDYVQIRESFANHNWINGYDEDSMHAV